MKQLPWVPRHLGKFPFAHVSEEEGQGAGDSCLAAVPAETVSACSGVTQSCLSQRPKDSAERLICLGGLKLLSHHFLDSAQA